MARKSTIPKERPATGSGHDHQDGPEVLPALSRREGKKFRLKDIDPRDTAGLGSEAKPRAKKALEDGIKALAELQDMLYAQDRWAVLLIFQAMDAAGKDGAIKHVMSGVNPQGCQVAGSKSPSAEELDHDFLWRCASSCPSGAASASSTARTTRMSSS